jgi:hypothetical protein
MDKVDRYRKMNDVVLLCGFTMGGFFGEYYLAVAKHGASSFAAQKWKAACALCVGTAVVLARRSYLPEPKEGPESEPTAADEAQRSRRKWGCPV